MRAVDADGGVVDLITAHPFGFTKRSIDGGCRSLKIRDDSLSHAAVRRGPDADDRRIATLTIQVSDDAADCRRTDIKPYGVAGVFLHKPDYTYIFRKITIIRSCLEP